MASRTAAKRRPAPSLGGVFQGSANAVADADALLAGLYPLVNVDHGVTRVLDVVRQFRGAFQDVGGVIGLTDHESAFGIDPAHELQNPYARLPLAVQLDRASRVCLGLLATNTRTNAPLQHVLHDISQFPDPTA